MGIQQLDKKTETPENLDKEWDDLARDMKNFLEKNQRKKPFDFGTITVYRHGSIERIKL